MGVSIAMISIAHGVLLIRKVEYIVFDKVFSIVIASNPQFGESKVKSTVPFKNV